MDIAFEYYWPRLLWLLQWLVRRQADHVSRHRLGLTRQRSFSAEDFYADDIHREGFYRSQVEKTAWRGVHLEYLELVIQVMASSLPRGCPMIAPRPLLIATESLSSSLGHVTPTLP